MNARVLLVEDDASLSNLLAQFLIRAGFSPVLCSTGAEGLSKWDHTCAAAVVDLGLPDIEGADLVAQLMAQVQVVPIVVSSGTPADKPELCGSHNGAAPGRLYFLQKPYLPSQLVELLIGLGV